MRGPRAGPFLLSAHLYYLTQSKDMASPTKQSKQDRRIAAVRAFNRLYPLKVGLLSPGYLHSPFSITEARVIHELATRPGTEVAGLRRELGLDAGYLSRILN